MLSKHEIYFESVAGAETIYAIHRRDSDEKLLNLDTGIHDAYVSEAVSHTAPYILELTDFANDSFSVAFPGDLQLSVVYDFLYYQQLGAAAAADDLLLTTITGKYTGAGVEDPADALPADIFPSLAEAKRVLNIFIDDSSKDQWLIDQLTDIVRRTEKRLGRWFKSRSTTENLRIERTINNPSILGGYNSEIVMTNFPINSITSITINDADQTDYDIDIRGSIGHILINPTTLGYGYAKVVANCGWDDVKSADEAPYSLVKRILIRRYQDYELPEDKRSIDLTDDEKAEIDSWRVPYWSSSTMW